MSGTAEKIVETFLRMLEQRDLAGARSRLAPGFIMIFPGDRKFTSLEDLVAWSGTRSRNTRKAIERFDVIENRDATIVYCIGTLEGEWMDGVRFSGIRYVDRFVVEGSRIVEQRVWNDFAEVRRPSGKIERKASGIDAKANSTS
jgi:hypothetical protein